MKLLKLAISDQRWDIAAHTLIIGLLRAKHKEDSLRSPRRVFDKVENVAEVPLSEAIDSRLETVD